MTTIKEINKHEFDKTTFFSSLEQLISSVSFLNPLQKKKCIKFILDLSSFFSNYFSLEDVKNTAVELCSKLEPIFIHEATLKRLTKVRIALYYCIFLDARLSASGEKLTPHHLELMKEEGLISSDSRICSYLEMKKKQKHFESIDLVDKVYPIKFSELLTKRFQEIVEYCKMEGLFSEDIYGKAKGKLRDLLSKGIVPHIDGNHAALVLSLAIFHSLKIEKKYIRLILDVFCAKYSLDKEKLRRQYYQFNRRIREV